MRRLATTLLSLIVVITLSSSLSIAQCGFLSGNSSENFFTSSLCAPVTASWDIQFSFIAPPDPSTPVFFRFEWNDPANTVQDIPAVCSGLDCSPSSGTQFFTYPSGLSNCEYFPSVTLAIDANMNGTIESNELCLASVRNKSIRSWDTDNTGTGLLGVNPSLTEQCVGEALTAFQIQDITIPNCGGFSVSNPNRNQLTRWVQFVYGDQNATTPGIPNVSIDTGGGSVQVTDNSGNLIAPFYGPIIEIPPLVSIADLNELSYPLNFGANTTIGESFRIFLRNWNTCNPYDSLPFNGLPPSNPIDGDYAPEVTSSEIVIIGPTVAQAGTDQEICGTSTFLTANTANVGNGQWTQVSGPGTLIFNDANSPNTAVNFNGAGYGTYLLEWRINLGSCVSTDTVEVIFNPNSTVPVCGPDQNICGLTTNLMANTINIGIGYWTQVGGPTGLVISDTSNAQSLITASNYGTYTLEWSSKNANCPEQSDQIDITFDENPSSANAGPDIATCGNTAVLNGATPTVGSGIWTILTSPAASSPVFSNIGSPSSSLQIDSFGTYQLLWTVSNGVCNPTYDTVEVTFIENPSPSNAGLDQDVCGLNTVLTGNTPLNGIGQWVKVSGPGNVTFTDSLNPQSSITVSAFGVYVLEWQISNANCIVLTDQVQITFFDNPSVSNAGTDQQICGNNTVLNASPISVGNGTWTLLNSPSGSNPFIANPVNRNSAVLIDSFGTYSFSWTVSNGVCSSNVDTVDLTFNRAPGIPVAGADQIICGQNTTLAANSPDAGIGTWIQVAGPSGLTINSPNNPQTSISTTNYGIYVLEWRFTNASCPPISDQVQITFNETPTLANAGIDKLVCGTSTSLEGNTLAIGTGQWTVVSSPQGSNPALSNIAAGNSNLNIDSFGVYILKWTSTNGSCPSSEDNVKISFAEIPDYTIANQVATRCFGNCDGVLSLQGSKGLAPYFFTLNGNEFLEGNSFTDLCAGNYNITVTDKNGCQSSGNVNIQEADSIEAIPSVINASCGANDGSINLSAFGGTGNLNFQWNNGEIAQNISGLISGLYIATIKDQNNCIELLSVAVNDIGGPSINVNSITSPTCNGQADGAIDIAVSGTSNTYLWSCGDKTEDIVNLQAGPYYVMALDTVNNCKTFRNINVSEPDEISLDVTVNNPGCGLSDGSASVLVSGGNGSNLVNWSTGATGSSVGALTSGVYSVTATDFKGCSSTKNFSVSDQGAPLIFTDSVNNVTCGSTNGAIYISTTGNSASYNYLWSNADTTEDISGVPVGNYSLEVTDTSSCKSYYVQDIIQKTAIIPEICMVTVGTLDSGAYNTNNTVLWSKLADPDAYDEFNVYRETTSSGAYQQIGSVSAKAPGIFTDTISNPFLKSYRYKISVVDTCGVESALSDYHKTIHLVQNIALASNTVNLLWDGYEGFPYSTFYIYRNSNAQGWELIDSLASNSFSYTDTPPFSIIDPDLFYAVVVESPQDCDPNKGEDYTRTRSNPSSAIFSPPFVALEGEFTTSVISVYPNPANNWISFTVKQVDAYKYNIINVNGVISETGNVLNTEEVINISSLETGFYILELFNDKVIYRTRFIKQ